MRTGGVQCGVVRTHKKRKINKKLIHCISLSIVAVGELASRRTTSLTTNADSRMTTWIQRNMSISAFLSLRSCSLHPHYLSRLHNTCIRACTMFLRQIRALHRIFKIADIIYMHNICQSAPFETYRLCNGQLHCKHGEPLGKYLNHCN